MLLRAAAFLAALSPPVVPAPAATVPAAVWAFDNPFCKVVAQVAPVAGGRGYGLALFTAAGKVIDAHVTLVGETDAYDADMVGARLSGADGDRESDALLVTLPDNARIGYFFVDSYVIDGAAPVTCASYVFAVGDRYAEAPANPRTIAARHLQAIGPLKCGHVYIPPRLRGQLESAVGDYGGRPLTVLARAYLDSNGYSVREQLIRSSGVEGLDQYELGALHEHQFAPAQFLCTPVVSTIAVELHYYP